MLGCDLWNNSGLSSLNAALTARNKVIYIFQHGLTVQPTHTIIFDGKNDRHKEYCKAAMSRTGDTARRLSTTVHKPTAAYGPGRPPVHEEDWTKVTVVLLNRQIVYLDLVAADIRAANGAAIKRAGILRALVDALAASDIDLIAATSEAELKEILSANLRKEDVLNGQ